MNIQLTNAAFDRARGDVDEAHSTLRETRSTADGRMTGVLGTSWVGVAADSLADAWRDWLVAATDVEEGLAAMGELIAAVQRDFNQQDADSEADMQQVAAHIVDRLG